MAISSGSSVFGRSADGKRKTGASSSGRNSGHGHSATRSAKAPASPELKPQITAARAGDHAAIFQSLVTAQHRPTAGEFHAQQDQPNYEPTDRLLVKRGERLLSHVQIARREMWLGPVVLPAASLHDLVTLPEFRSQGLGSSLLAVAERRLAEDEAVLGIAQTAAPRFLMRHGWFACARHSFSQGSAPLILAQIDARRAPPACPLGKEPLPLNLRLWRRVELAALIRLYDENTAGTFGPRLRSEAYWQWLVSRRGYERIYVAIEGPDLLELDETTNAIVGYAVMHKGRIVELMTSAARPDAAEALLSRACGDALEHGYHTIRLDAPTDHPLHALIAEAGGQSQCCPVDDGEVVMGKLLAPLRLLGELRDEIGNRARAAELPCPCDLGLAVDLGGQKQRLRIDVTRRSTTIRTDLLGRSYLTLSQAEFSQMLLGYLDVEEALHTGRITASTRLAGETARALFPRLPMWLPPLDELPG